MDRTRRLRQAREQAKKKARQAEEEAADLDQLVIETREKVEAAKAAKLRSAESRRMLEELQAELTDDQDQDQDQDQAESEEDASNQFVSKSDFGSFLASSLKSVVSISNNLLLYLVTNFSLSFFSLVQVYKASHYLYYLLYLLSKQTDIEFEFVTRDEFQGGLLRS